MNINLNYQYPNNPHYRYEARLERLNLDKEKENDIRSGKGFAIGSSHGIRKDIYDINGIFSPKFGPNLNDLDASLSNYRCSCNYLTGRLNIGRVCPKCGQKVHYCNDNLDTFGWISLKDPYHLIHPNLYKLIGKFIGEKRFNNMLRADIEKDEDGFTLKKDIFKSNAKSKKDEKYYGIGLMKFYEQFDEIMDYYLKTEGKKPGKLDLYQDIMKNKDKIFIQSIPVYTTLLRPFRIDGEKLHYEGTNANYNMINKLAMVINNDELKIFRKSKSKLTLMYDAQKEYQDMYSELEEVLAHKKGMIRSLFGGRYNYTARLVITGDPYLRSDEIKMSYYALVVVHQQTIINILKKENGNYTYNSAYKRVMMATLDFDPVIGKIIDTIIRSHPSKRGFPYIVNRNPTLEFGGILQMYVVGYNKSYTLSLSLSSLKYFAADFDGDALNVFSIINKDFLKKAEEVFNPRNNMCISHNDGLYNPNCNRMTRDTIINANAMVQLSRKYYSQDQINKIKYLQTLS